MFVEDCCRQQLRPVSASDLQTDQTLARAVCDYVDCKREISTYKDGGLVCLYSLETEKPTSTASTRLQNGVSEGNRAREGDSACLRVCEC